jgi:hypothetical protein
MEYLENYESWKSESIACDTKIVKMGFADMRSHKGALYKKNS